MSKPSKTRLLQVINNVAEEYVDLGQTDFATKRELCEAILFLRKESQDHADAHRITKSKFGIAILNLLKLTK